MSCDSTSKRKRESEERMTYLQQKIAKYQQEIYTLQQEIEANKIPRAYESGQVIITCEELEYPNHREMECEFRIGFTLEGYKQQVVNLKSLSPNEDKFIEFRRNYTCCIDVDNISVECDSILDCQEWRDRIYDNANYDESPPCGSIIVTVKLQVYCNDKDVLDKFCNI